MPQEGSNITNGASEYHERAQLEQRVCVCVCERSERAQLTGENSPRTPEIPQIDTKDSIVRLDMSKEENVTTNKTHHKIPSLLI